MSGADIDICTYAHVIVHGNHVAERLVESVDLVRLEVADNGGHACQDLVNERVRLPDLRLVQW
jgi:hypothetical protein